MIPAPPLTIKQSLNKAYRLIKPKRAAMEAFKGNLIQLLNQINEKESEENVKIYLMDILKDTFFAADYQETETYSSPACYANATGLREGFDDPFLAEQQISASSDIYYKPASTLPNQLIINSDLKEAIRATKHSVRQIITAIQANSQTDAIELEKKIDKLVYQLYELTADEIDLLEMS